MKRRILAVCICIVFLFAFVASFAFIAKAADHDCAGEDCTICAEIAACASLFRRLSLCAFAALLCLCAVFALQKVRIAVPALAFCTPVSRFDILNA